MAHDLSAVSNDAQAQAFIRDWDQSAQQLESISSSGRMVWRSWGEGPAVVLLHGGSGSWTHWIRNIPYLSRHCRVLAADLPGLGDSPTPAEPYSAESLAQIISEGIDQALPGTTPFDLVGFSFGGIVGGHIASLQALRIRSLTIVGSPPFGLGSTGPANALKAVAQTLSFDQALDLHRYNLALFMIADALKVDALALRAHHENLLQARLKSRKIARTDTLAQALRRAPCTLRGIWGSEDVTAHPDVASIQALFKEIEPHGEFVALPGVGHWAAYEDYERFNALIETYVLQRR